MICSTEMAECLYFGIGNRKCCSSDDHLWFSLPAFPLPTLSCVIPQDHLQLSNVGTKFGSAFVNATSEQHLVGVSSNEAQMFTWTQRWTDQTSVVVRSKVTVTSSGSPGETETELIDGGKQTAVNLVSVQNWSDQSIHQCVRHTSKYHQYKLVTVCSLYLFTALTIIDQMFIENKAGLILWSETSLACWIHLITKISIKIDSDLIINSKIRNSRTWNSRS